MAFDAGMMAAVVFELRQSLVGARVEKINQPEKDELLLSLRGEGESFRLLLSASSGSPRLCLTNETKENPALPPAFCIMLRKHLSSARISGVRQPGFERIAILTFDGRDSMGFPTKRALVCEILGKFSNLILLDGDPAEGSSEGEGAKILSVLKPVDLSKSEKRPLLPGMRYRLPPPQEKADPRQESREAFASRRLAAGREKAADKFLVETYLGVAPVTAREIVFDACGRTDASLGETDGERLFAAFRRVFDRVNEGNFAPCLLLSEGKPTEFSFFPLRQYGAGENPSGTGDGKAKTELLFLSASETLRRFYAMRAAGENLRLRAQDILQILKTAESRLLKKIAVQEEELAACGEKEALRRKADLITANLYALKKGDERVKVIDYYDPDAGETELLLDRRLTPAENAARCYKKYTKLKTAEQILTARIKEAREELAYLATVREGLGRSEGSKDLEEIRQELRDAGYGRGKAGRNASKSANGRAGGRKKSGGSAAPGAPMAFRTRGGYLVLCGRNNLQNEQISFHTAEKDDWWFHVKNAPGSHAVLCLEGKGEPPAEDFTDAAVIAATYSSLGEGSAAVPVDYTPVRNLKKPAGAKPGFVIYHKNYDAFVKPDKALCEAMRIK